jgi:hypothetical protein
MTEMEQEKRASLHADVMLRRALDLKAKDNKVIAEFMGVVFHDDENQYYNADGLHIGNTLQYRTSWDWLMPVIEKIYQLGLDNESALLVRDAVAEANLDSTYQAVVEFINQLNN